MKKKIKTIEPSRFLKTSEMQTIDGGKCTHLTCSVEQKYDGCSSGGAYVLCPQTYVIQCNTKTITCSGGTFPAYQNCPVPGKVFSTCGELYTYP